MYFNRFNRLVKVSYYDTHKAALRNIFVVLMGNDRKEKFKMVSLKTFVEDMREERREKNERLLKTFTLILSVLFLALSIWSTTL